MLKFIAGCMGIIAFAFFAMPIFFNVAQERTTMIQTAQINAETQQPTSDSLVASTEDETGAFLNDIAPAAGTEMLNDQNEQFGAAFDTSAHPAL